MEVKIAMWMLVGLFSFLVITSAGAQSCPANQIASDAQITLREETVVPASSGRVLSELLVGHCCPPMHERAEKIVLSLEPEKGEVHLHGTGSHLLRAQN